MKRVLLAVCVFAAVGTPTEFVTPGLPGTLPGKPSRPQFICGSPQFSNPLVLKQAVQNTAMFAPNTYRLMIESQNESIFALSEDTLGTEHEFFVYDFNTRSFYTVDAVLMAKKSLTEIWVDKAEISNGHIDGPTVDSLQAALEDRTPPTSRDPAKGIVAIEEDFLGTPPNTGYSNGYIHFLITDIRDNWDSSRSGSSYVAGFFLSNDQPNPTNGSYAPASNRRDLLYIDSYPGIYMNGVRDPADPLPILAHELQHLIQWRYDPSEETFLNEGCSLNAEVMCGYPLRSPSDYFRNTKVGLLSWHDTSDDAVLADYSRAALFIRYAWEQFGDPFIKGLVCNPLHGLDGMNFTLSTVGSSLKATDVFQNWAVANMLNDTSAGKEYGYRYGFTGKPVPSYTFNDPNVCFAADTASGMTATYLNFENGDSLVVSYNSSGLDVSAIKSGSLAGVQTVPPAGTYYEAAFGKDFNRIVLALVNRSPTGNGTISLTSSGAVSSIRSEISYDRGVPDTLEGAAFLGLPDSSEGSGWAVEFTPPYPSFRLLKARIYAVFAQELQGSQASYNSQKEFLFHVWANRDGFPGAELIPPIVTRVERASFDDVFIDVDLSGFSDKLSNLSGPIYVGFTEDGTLSTSVGLTHPAESGHTFAYLSSGGKWRKMSDLRMEGGYSLSGWDLMIRAVFSINTIDSEPPKLKAGITQSELEPDMFAVSLTGDSALRPESICGTILQGTTTSQLHFNSLGPSSFVSEPLKLANGISAVTLKGAKALGTQYEDTSFVFTSCYFRSHAGTLISPDSLLTLTVPEGSGEFFATIHEGSVDTLDARATRVYSIGPKLFRSYKPIGITLTKVRFDTSAYSPAVLSHSKWYGIPFEFRDETLSASTTLLSTFALLPKGIISGPLESETPGYFALHQNYPNPFNLSTTIIFDLPKEGIVTLRLFDLLGREVATLVDGYCQPGSHRVSFDASRLSLASGLYFYKITASGGSAVRKMMLVK